MFLLFFAFPHPFPLLCLASAFHLLLLCVNIFWSHFSIFICSDIYNVCLLNVNVYFKFIYFMLLFYITIITIYVPCIVLYVIMYLF